MSIRKDAGEMVEFLNSLVETDRYAMADLLCQRVPCNRKLADHPTVQVAAHNRRDTTIPPGGFRVGILGVLNGYYGIHEDGPNQGMGAIVAEYEEGKFLGFRLVEPVEINDPSTHELVHGTALPRPQCRWWLRTRPCSHGVQIGPEGIPAAVEFYVPWWAWPFELLHWLVFGKASLSLDAGAFGEETYGEMIRKAVHAAPDPEADPLGYMAAMAQVREIAELAIHEVSACSVDQPKE
jgi:hypothetical protein